MLPRSIRLLNSLAIASHQSPPWRLSSACEGSHSTVGRKNAMQRRTHKRAKSWSVKADNMVELT